MSHIWYGKCHQCENEFKQHELAAFTVFKINFTLCEPCLKIGLEGIRRRKYRETAKTESKQREIDWNSFENL